MQTLLWGSGEIMAKDGWLDCTNCDKEIDEGYFKLIKEPPFYDGLEMMVLCKGCMKNG